MMPLRVFSPISSRPWGFVPLPGIALHDEIVYQLHRRGSALAYSHTQSHLPGSKAQNLLCIFD